MIRPARLATLAVALAFAAAVSSRADEPFSLGLPVACEPGRTCFVQNYVDRDPGPGVRDFACGAASYDGHNGTDFRVPAVRPGGAASVLAVADGQVLRLRDGVADRVLGAKDDPAGAAGQDCGNGLVIGHAGGFETQYCHLEKGSLAVKPGDRVERGRVLGRVGLSGRTEFPHLHLTVRRNGRALDPFAPAEEAACGADLASSLWRPELRERLAEAAGGAILAMAFAEGPVSREALDTGVVPEPGPDPAALVAYVRALNLRAGDRQTLRLLTPEGGTLAEREEAALPRPRAESLLFAGRRRPAGGWPARSYAASFTVERDGRVVLERTVRWPIGDASSRK